MKKRLLYIVNVDWFFASHRLKIAEEAMSKGYEIHLLTEFTTLQNDLSNLGLITHALPASRGKKGIVDKIKYAYSIYKTIKEVSPDLVHAVTIQPILLSGLVSKFMPIPAYVVAISGLGPIFTSNSFPASLRKLVIICLYKISLTNKNKKVIFQNSHDARIITEISPLHGDESVLIPGSGVDLNEFNCSSEAFNTRPIVLMVSRLLKDKGVLEFVTAAEKLYEKGIDAEFMLIGEPDYDSPTSMTKIEFNKLIQNRAINAMGRRTDIAIMLKKAAIFVLPSYYGEGFSKAIMEASASGKPVITTTVPGCADAVIDGITGLVIPPRDIESLEQSIEKLLLNETLRAELGRNGRQHAEKYFSIDSVVEQHMSIYDSLT